MALGEGPKTLSLGTNACADGLAAPAFEGFGADKGCCRGELFDDGCEFEHDPNWLKIRFSASLRCAPQNLFAGLG